MLKLEGTGRPGLPQGEVSASGGALAALMVATCTGAAATCAVGRSAGPVRCGCMLWRSHVWKHRLMLSMLCRVLLGR